MRVVPPRREVNQNRAAGQGKRLAFPDDEWGLEFIKSDRRVRGNSW